MRIIFLILLGITFLTSLLIWEVSRPQDKNKPGVLSKFLASVGVKQKVIVQKEKVDAMVGQLVQDQERFFEQMNDQQQFLENSSRQLQTVTEVATTLMEKNDADLLRLKVMMEEFENQNRLMIERGKDLVLLNKAQMQQRRENSKTAYFDALDADLVKQRIFVQMRQLFDYRKEYVERVKDQIQRMHENIAQLKDRAKAAVSLNNTATDHQKMVDQMQRLNEKSDLLLTKINERRSQIEIIVADIKQKSFDNNERVKDMIRFQHDKMSNTNAGSKGASELAKERMQDRMESIKQQRENLTK